ncbi:hypothetical protein [Burkholderia cepacia]|uniref:hypothetical protein n=1 Tax=Burkholderia cepacia TaxID=292 RepID=UPI0012D9F8C7|nr:hypothetical protein [Burkholderia cepacia]
MTQSQRKSLIFMELWSDFQTEFNFSANFVGKGHLFCHSYARKFAEKMTKSLICMDRRDHLFCEPTTLVGATAEQVGRRLCSSDVANGSPTGRELYERCASSAAGVARLETCDVFWVAKIQRS